MFLNYHFNETDCKIDHAEFFIILDALGEWTLEEVQTRFPQYKDTVRKLRDEDRFLVEQILCQFKVLNCDCWVVCNEMAEQTVRFPVAHVRLGSCE